MKRLIYTLTVALLVILAPAIFTACEDDDHAATTTELTPAFTWADTNIPLETDNGWGVTRYKDHIALSNFNEKCQYLLAWDGNMANGEKSNAFLKIAQAGRQLQNLPLDKLSIRFIDGKYYRIEFAQGDKTGTLILSIDTD